MSTVKTLLILAAGYAAVQIIGGKKPHTSVENPTNTNVVEPDITYIKGYEIETFPLSPYSYGYVIRKNSKEIRTPNNAGFESKKAALIAAKLFIENNSTQLNGIDISKIA